VLCPLTNAPTSKKKTLRERAYDVAMALIVPLTSLIERTSKVPTTPFLRKGDFPWIPRLESHWREIRAELEQVLTDREDLPLFHEINADATDIRSKDWQSFFLYGFGLRSEANCARCPKTAALVESIPGMTTALFSILAPGARLPPHTGPWKGVIRYHLGLMVPSPAEACGIKVDGTTAHWHEGESMVFDDTFEHSVWNDSDGTRVVLFLDILRPCRVPGSSINLTVTKLAALTPFIRSSHRRHRKWERTFAAKHGDAIPSQTPGADRQKSGHV
jgi:ornithine lipid ester-linked acyl 2-hydroxylase